MMDTRIYTVTRLPNGYGLTFVINNEEDKTKFEKFTHYNEWNECSILGGNDIYSVQKLL